MFCENVLRANSFISFGRSKNKSLPKSVFGVFQSCLGGDVAVDEPATHRFRWGSLRDERVFDLQFIHLPLGWLSSVDACSFS